MLSSFFNVSINTLLGAPRQLICQCCGMPLDDSSISKDPDGTFNEQYCKWCYHDGNFAYQNLESLIDFIVGHMRDQSWSAEQAREHLEKFLPTLDHWRKTDR